MKWFGLAEVVPRPGSDALGPGSAGAFVNVIGEAESAEDFQRLIASVMEGYGFNLLRLNECERLESRLCAAGVAEELLREAQSIPERTTLVYSTFFTYPPEATA